MAGSRERLICRRPRVFIRLYDLIVDGQPIGRIDFSNPADGAIEVDGRSTRAYREPNGVWRYEEGDAPIAFARRHQATPLSLQVFAAGHSNADHSWRIEPDRRKPLRFTLSGPGGEAGIIHTKLGLLSNSIVVSGEFSTPNDVLAFMVWLIGIHWPGIVGLASASKVRRS